MTTRIRETLGTPKEQELVEVPEWFFLGGWDTVPVGWLKRALPGVPYRYVELAADISDRLMVIITGGEELDQKRWVHVSMSRPGRLPTYDDMCWVKRAFIGDDKTAYQVFPPKAKHVNIHSYCLHLWHCVDGDVTPDFTKNGQI